MSKCTRTQPFGANSNPIYLSSGMKGHTGVDDSCGYGSKVYALKKGVVYKILDREHPARDGSGYWCVFMISEENGKFVEWQIGHLSKIYCKVGDIVEPWDFIGEEGNRGRVFSGNIQITKAMQDAGDKRGAHRHYNKKYLTQTKEIGNNIYLTQWTPDGVMPIVYTDTAGFHYIVDNANNGYSGSVDCGKDIDDGRKLVEQHSTPPLVPPVISKPDPTTKQLRIKFVFNNCEWGTIPEKMKQIKDFFAPKFEIQCDIFHTYFKDIPFKSTIGLDASSGVETHITTNMVDPVWYDKNVTTLAIDYDMVLFYITDKDKQGFLTSAGIRGDNNQGPVELTIFGGNETDHAYNQGVDQGNAFAFFACHEIAHGIAMLFNLVDNTHKYFYTATPQLILNDYNLNQSQYFSGLFQRILKALLYIASLIRR